MGNKFTVINSTEENKNKKRDHLYRIARMSELWERQYYTALEKS